MANKVQKTPAAILKLLRQRKSTPLEAVDFNFRTYCQRHLSIIRSDVYTHYVHPYPGKLLSYIPAFFLSDHDLIPKDALVLDPFAGSGTVLLECLVNPQAKRSCIGVEVNPLGRLISRVKTTPLNIQKLQLLKAKLLRDSAPTSKIRMRFRNIDLWFAPLAQKRLHNLLARIMKLDADQYRDFFLVCFSRIVRKCSLADPNVPPPVVLKTSKYIGNPKRHRELLRFLKHSKNPDVLELFSQTADANIARLKSLVDVLHNERKKVESEIVWDDARILKRGSYDSNGRIDTTKLRRLRSGSVGAIITSPPYLTAQKYVRSTKLELLWLGLADDESIQSINNKTIGTEQAPHDFQLKGVEATKMDLLDLYRVSVPEISERLQEIRRESFARALDVGHYFWNMDAVFGEMYRVLRRNSFAVIVMGNSQVLGRPFPTHRYLARIAERKGFTIDLVIQDPIRARKMLTGRNKTGGYIEKELILVLKKSGTTN